MKFFQPILILSIVYVHMEEIYTPYLQSITLIAFINRVVGGAGVRSHTENDDILCHFKSFLVGEKF